jgi:hypothetical protein
MDFLVQSHLNTFFQNSTPYGDASFNEENAHKLWTGCIKIPSSTGGLLGKNSPSLATYSHLNIILKVAKIQLNSSHLMSKSSTLLGPRTKVICKKNNK